MKSIKAALAPKNKDTYNAALAAGSVGPSENISPSELWVKLSSRKTRPHQVFDFPRLGEDGEPIGKIAIITPTTKEIMGWNVEVERRLQEMYKANGLDVASADRLAALKQHAVMDQILSQAIRDPDDLNAKPLAGMIAGGKAAMPSDVLTGEEMAVLYQMYLITQANFGPQVAVLTDDLYNAWLDKIERGADDDSFLASLTWGATIELLKLFVSSMRQRMANGSPGTSPGAEETSS